MRACHYRNKMPLPQRFEIVEPDAKVVKRHIAAHDS